jgi:hypothetical protein
LRCDGLRFQLHAVELDADVADGGADERSGGLVPARLLAVDRKEDVPDLKGQEKSTGVSQGA